MQHNYIEVLAREKKKFALKRNSKLYDAVYSINHKTEKKKNKKGKTTKAIYVIKAYNNHEIECGVNETKPISGVYNR